MIEIVLLALPITCLLCGIVHFSISLWRLSTGKFSTKDVGRTQGKLALLSESQIMGMSPVHRNNITLISFKEWNDESIGFHIYAMYMKSYSKGFETHNFELMFTQEEPEISFDAFFKAVLNVSSCNISNSAVPIKPKNPSINKEKSLWLMQNLL